MTIIMKNKTVSKYIAGLMAAGMLGFSAPKIANAEGLNIRLDKNNYGSKITAMYSIPFDFLGGGKNTKYNSRNKSLESQVAGLTQVPALNAGSSSQPYFEKYEGNWFTRPVKEFSHGATSILHPYNTKADGTTRWLPGYSTITKEGSIFAPIYGIFASVINGTSKLVGSKHRVYNPFEENFWRTLGTAALEIGVGIASSSGGGGSSEPLPEDTEGGDL